MRPIDVARANKLDVTRDDGERLTAHGYVANVGPIGLDMEADTHVEPGHVLRIWPPPGGLATGSTWVQGARYAVVVDAAGTLGTTFAASGLDRKGWGESPMRRALAGWLALRTTIGDHPPQQADQGER